MRRRFIHSVGNPVPERNAIVDPRPRLAAAAAGLFFAIALCAFSARAQTPNPYLVGSWGPVIAWPHIAISVAELADGRVLSWSSTQADAISSNAELTHAAVHRPGTGAFQIG